ncbi:MAG: hypothetical protein AB1758_32050, partial [Candidatus Eremiobacterota bacterium]
EDRLIKTLLLSALAPEVPSLKNLTPARLAALNHGTIRSPIAGQEAGIVATRIRNWAGRVGEIRITDDTHPIVSVQLSGVDTESILAQVQGEDNPGNRRRKLKELLYDMLRLSEPQQGQFHFVHGFVWRGTRRAVQIVYGNVREFPEDTLQNEEDSWKLILDFPFDEPNYGPRDDLGHLEDYERHGNPPSRTLFWLPSFLSGASLKELGTLVKLDYILTGDRFQQVSGHLSPTDRPTARTLLENQASALRNKLRAHLEMAYGIRNPAPGVLDSEYQLENQEQFRSLAPGFAPRPPVAASLHEGLLCLLDQALSHQFPAHPRFEIEGEIKPTHATAVWHQIRHALEARDGRHFVEDRGLRTRIRQIAVPLRLGEMGETHFLLHREWHDHFERRLHDEKPETLTVGRLWEWMDLPQARGLPPLLRNLVVLTYAGQTNRTFSLRGADLADPGVDDLKPEMELVQQALPPEEAWKEAVRRLSELLARKDLPELCTGSNVAGLSQALGQFLAEHRKDHAAYTEALRRWLDSFQIDNSSQRGASPPPSHPPRRLKVAEEAEAWLALLDVAQPDRRILAASQAPTSSGLAAIRRSLEHAARNLEALRNSSNREVIQGMGQVDTSAAQGILQRVTESLNQDDFAQKEPLAEVLKREAAQAVKLLVQPKPPKRPNAVKSGEKKGLTLPEALAELDALRVELTEGRRLDIQWTVWEADR